MVSVTLYHKKHKCPPLNHLYGHQFVCEGRRLNSLGYHLIAIGALFQMNYQKSEYCCISYCVRVLLH